jgi:hypothetical protein
VVATDHADLNIWLIELQNRLLDIFAEGVFESEAHNHDDVLLNNSSIWFFLEVVVFPLELLPFVRINILVGICKAPILKGLNLLAG